MWWRKVVSNIFVVSFQSTCYDIISYLEPCTTHRVNVTPVFDYSGEKLIGIGKSTQGTTLEDGEGGRREGKGRGG